MGQSLTQEQINAITGAIFTGRKIEAIKLYRDSTDASLAEAKEFIEKLEAELRLQHPDKFTAAPQAQSKIMIAISVAIAIGIAIILLFLSRAAP
jgi:ribosomal protein L7/L12